MDIEANRNIKDKNKRKFKKSSRIIENLDEIKLKSNEEYIVDDDVDLYFRHVSSCIEKEGIEGLLMDKLKYKDDSLELLVNRDDVYYDFEKSGKELINDMEKSVAIKSLCEISAGLDLYNSKICEYISGFKFTNNKLSEDLIIEKDRFNKSSGMVYLHDEQLIHQNDSILNLDNDNIDVDIDIHQPLDVNDSCLSPSMPPSPPRDGQRTIAEMTQLLQQSEYSYFNFAELKIQDLRQSAKIKSSNQAKIKRKNEAPRFEALIENNRSKFIKFTKVTKKQLFVSDCVIESRSSKSFNLENELEFDYKTHQFFEMSHRKENARLFSENTDIFDIENNHNLEIDFIGHDELPERSEMRFDDNENVDVIPSTDQASLSKNSVNELIINTQIDNDISLDGYDLIEEPEQIKIFYIQYAKKFKYIDTKKLKDDIWNLICLNSNDGLNVIVSFQYIHFFNFCILLG